MSSDTDSLKYVYDLQKMVSDCEVKRLQLHKMTNCGSAYNVVRHLTDVQKNHVSTPYNMLRDFVRLQSYGFGTALQCDMIVDTTPEAGDPVLQPVVEHTGVKQMGGGRNIVTDFELALNEDGRYKKVNNGITTRFELDACCCVTATVNHLDDYFDNGFEKYNCLSNDEHVSDVLLPVVEHFNRCLNTNQQPTQRTVKIVPIMFNSIVNYITSDIKITNDGIQQYSKSFDHCDSVYSAHDKYYNSSVMLLLATSDNKLYMLHPSSSTVVCGSINYSEKTKQFGAIKIIDNGFETFNKTINKSVKALSTTHRKQYNELTHKNDGEYMACSNIAHMLQITDNIVVKLLVAKQGNKLNDPSYVKNLANIFNKLTKVKGVSSSVNDCCQTSFNTSASKFTVSATFEVGTLNEKQLGQLQQLLDFTSTTGNFDDIVVEHDLENL